MHRVLQFIRQSLQSISAVTFYFIVLLLLHFAFVWNIIPMRNINHIGEYPISHGDYPYHYGQVLTNLEIFEKYGQVWGYSTDFYAGYLTGITTTVSSKMWLFFAYLSKNLGIPVIVSFNVFPIVLLFFIPFLFYFSIRRFDLDPLDSILATFLMIIYFWSSDIFNYFIKWGVISFSFSIFLVFFCLSHLYHFVNKEKDIVINSIVLALLISLAGWIHPLSVIYLITGSTIILIADIKKVSPYKFIMLIIICIIAILVQLPWLYPFLSIKSFPNASIGNQFASQQFNMAGGLLGIKNDLIGRSDNASLHRLLIFFSIYGLYHLWKIKQKVVCVFFGLFPLVLLFLAYGGAFVNSLEPKRFGPNAFLILIIPASVGIMFIVRIFLKEKSDYLTRFGIFIFLFVMIWPQLVIIRKDLWHYSLIHAPSSETNLVIKWLKENTNEDGRILYENSYYGYNNDIEIGFLNISSAGYISLASGREFVGGPMEWNGPLDFIYGKISGIPIEHISINEILQFVEIYNVHWIVVYSNGSKSFFNKYPRNFIKVGGIKYFDIYKVSSPSDFFILGKGKITKEKGELLISQIEGNQIVIKYHWVPFLRSYPEVDIKREIIKNDPYGFIKISNPPKNVKIWVQK
jgi:hypothetical protein